MIVITKRKEHVADFVKTKDEGKLEFFVYSALLPKKVIGSLEQTREKLENVTAAFGNLIDVLAEKGILDEKDVKFIIEDYETELTFKKQESV
jgi:hypothetical protein